MLRNSVNRVVEQFAELADDDPWDDLSMLNRNRLWLTRTEAEDLGKELTEVIERYRHGRTAADHPAGTRQVTTLVAVVPAGKPPAADPPAKTGPSARRGQRGEES